MAKRKTNEPVEGEAPPKKSFLRKIWDKGGKHVAIAAGAAVGAAALGAGAQYVDKRSGGKYSGAIGRATEAGRTAIGRLRDHAQATPPPPPPPPRPAVFFPNLGATTTGPGFLEQTAHHAEMPSGSGSGVRELGGRLHPHGWAPPAAEHVGQDQLARERAPPEPEQITHIGPSGVHNRRRSIRHDMLPADGARVRQIGVADLTEPTYRLRTTPTQSDPIDYTADHPPVSQRHRRIRRPTATPRRGPGR